MRDSFERKNILGAIEEAIRPWLKDGGLTEDVNLIKDIGIDSVGILQLLLNLEKRYQIQIPEYELDMATLSSLEVFIDYIENKIHADC